MSTDVPSLGSLGQAARGNQLKSARIIMFVLGGLMLALNLFLMVSAESQLRNQGIGGEDLKELVALNQVIAGVGILVAIVFIVLGALVYSFPVPCTIAALVLYIVYLVVQGALNPLSIVSGIIIKIFIVIGLVKSVSSARAYEQERRSAPPADLGPTPARFS
jgi:hypothetical protein